MPEPKTQADVKRVIEKNTTPLYEFNSVFPFAIFPETVRVYEYEVHIIYREFFFYRRDFPILLKDLKNVTVASGIIFATMNFEIAFQELNPKPIAVLKKSEARYARKLIMGLSMLVRENVDTGKMSIDQVKDMALKLGK